MKTNINFKHFLVRHGEKVKLQDLPTKPTAKRIGKMLEK
jgi:hypothetical protein